MKVGLIYFLIIIIANTLGSISGMGGGVLIKPIFDFIGAHSLESISFYSTIAVFTMSVVSTLKQISSGQKLRWKTVLYISFGALIGGSLGKVVFSSFLESIKNDGIVNLIQIVVTVITLLYALIYTHFNLKKFNLSNNIWKLLCGTILGFFASFLGIGGGPINVALLMMMFSLPIKEATIYSICTIFFSQLAKISSIVFNGELNGINLKMLWFIIPAAMIGGFLGASLNKIVSSKYVDIVFQWMIVIVIVINIYNGYQILTV